MTITRTPAPVDVPVTITTTGPLDKSPASVATNQDPALAPKTQTVSRPLVTLSTNNASTANTTTPAAIVEDVATSNNVSVPQPLYLTVSDEGAVVLSKTNSINFEGSGVSVVNTNGTAVVTINAGGNAALGNWAFNGNTQYNLFGGTINNSDLSHGATAGLTLPSNGDGNSISMLNYYGNIVLTSATGPSQTKSWVFDNNGNITLPTNTSAINYANGSSILNGLAGTYGNSNVVTLLAGFGSNILSTTGNVTGGNVITAGAISAASATITGLITGGNINTTGRITAAGNIVTVGNIIASGYASVTGNITGSYFIGNGSLLTGISASSNSISNGTSNVKIASPNGNITMAIASDNIWTFDNVGAINVPGAGTIRAANRAAGPINLVSNNFVQLQWTTDVGNADPNYTSAATNWVYVDPNGINLETGINTANVAAWHFGTDGILTLPGNSVNGSLSSIENGQIVSLNGQANGLVNLTAFGSAANNVASISVKGFDDEVDRIQISTYNPTDDAPMIWSFNTAGDLTTPISGNIFFSPTANNSVIVPGGTGVKIAADRGDITQGYVNVTSSGIIVDALGSSTSDITIRAGDDITLRGGDKTSAPGARGGDIFVSAGDGGPDTNVEAGDGGYVEITGGQGGNADVGTAGNGGSVNLIGGNGGAANEANAQPAGNGGIATVVGGTAGDNLGNLSLSGPGGNAEIYGGFGSWDTANNRPGGPAGDVGLYGGNWGFNFTPSGNITVNTYNGNDFRVWKFDNDGNTLFPGLSTVRGDTTSGTISGYTLRIGDGNAQAIITTPDGSVTTTNDSQRLVINPGQGYLNGEGGDIYLWAGRGGPGDQANAVSAGSGGDIKIRGGQGGGVNGGGGYIRMEAGDGATGSEGDSGAAGFIEITGGSSGVGRNGGYVRITSGQGDVNGGDANLVGGYGASGLGGTVNIIGGTSGNSLADYGNVNITSGASTWVFDNTGKLTVPGEGYIRAIGDTISLKSYDLANSLGYGLRVGTTGGLYLEQGSDPAYLTLDSNAGNAQIYAASGQSGAAGKNLTIYAGSADEASYNTSTGGNIYLQAGAGGSNDGGGGGQGGWVNITSGSSNDPAGHNGNVSINTGGSNTWTFDYTGNVSVPGSIVTSSGQGGNISGANVIGANTVVVSGNITGGNIETTGYLSANSVGVSTSVATRTLVTDPVSFVDLTAVFGARAFISDGNLAAVGNFGAQVSGGGSNNVPIWSDGANWYIG